MSKVTMSKGKFDGINACADEHGVIAAAAMDQRGSLMKAIAKARGDGGKATAADLSEFKTTVTEVLTKYATAILMDPEYGLEAIKHRAPDVEIAADIAVEIDAQSFQPRRDLAEHLFRARVDNARVAQRIKLALLPVVEQVKAAKGEAACPG